MAMISFNTFSVVLMRVLDACSISSLQNYAKKIHVFERGFGERKHNNFRWIVGACCLTFFFPRVNLRKEVGNISIPRHIMVKILKDKDKTLRAAREK